MRRKKPFLVHGIILIAALVLLTAAEDVQVIHSRRSVISIYSYGGASPSHAISEFRDSSRGFRRKTGALTDVATVPPRAVSAPPVKALTTAPTLPAGSPGPRKVAAPSAFGTSAMAVPADPTPPAEAALPMASLSRTVTVGWNAPAEPSVAGYHVYTGDASGQYSDRTSVGNQTSAQILISRSTIYIAVSAYTAEGLESALSDELIVVADNVETASGSGGSQTLENDVR